VNKANISRIEKLFNQACIRYTEFYAEHDESVLILDTIGQLTSAYQYADYALIGGGFSGNLHNILEPAVYGLPVFFGPRHQKFPEAQSFIDEGIGFVVENAEQLSQKIKTVDNQEELKPKIEAFMQSHSGAADKIVHHSFISKILNQN
jgi:3-deoxy-D-manno-octulosonic-acid transferase